MCSSDLVEAESRKIGVLQVPTTLLLHMRASPCLRLEAPLDERVQFLLGDYAHMLRDPTWLKERLRKLGGLQPNEVIDRWCRQIDEGEWQTLVTDLLINHYDPLYLRSMTRSYPTLDESPVVRPQSLSPEAITALAAELRQRSFSRT